jgi:hypothetical protein
MREVLYDADWQLLRINCLSARNADGGWTTLTGCTENLEMIHKYLYVAQLGDEGHCRRYRVNNCLNAVVMGYVGQKADKELIEKVRWFRNNYVSMGTWNKPVVNYVGRTWNWSKQTEKLRLWNEDDLEFLRVNLLVRARNGSQRTRPELHRFLKCIEDAMG